MADNFVRTTYPINAESRGGVVLGHYPYDCGWQSHRTLRGYLRSARRHLDGKVLLLSGHAAQSGTQIGRVEIACRDLVAAIEAGEKYVSCSVHGV